jgi:hypothetical protein
MIRFAFALSSLLWFNLWFNHFSLTNQILLIAVLLGLSLKFFWQYAS